MLFPVCNIITFFWTIKEWFSLCSSWIYCASRICKVFSHSFEKISVIIFSIFFLQLTPTFQDFTYILNCLLFPYRSLRFSILFHIFLHSILKIGWFLLSYFELQFFPPNMLSFPICCLVQVILKFQLLYFLTPQCFLFWLKITELYCLTVLKARSPKSRCQQDHALSDGCWGEPFLASSSFWCSPAILSIPGLVDASLQIFSLCAFTLFSLCVSVSVSKFPCFMNCIFVF